MGFYIQIDNNDKPFLFFIIILSISMKKNLTIIFSHIKINLISFINVKLKFR